MASARCSQVTREISTRDRGYTSAFGCDEEASGPGNPTSFKGTPNTFNADNQTTSVCYGYTGDGLRAWKSDASGRTYSLYDGADPVAELDANGSIQALNTFVANRLVSRHTTATNASVFYTFDERGNVAWPKRRQPPDLTIRSGGCLVSCFLLPKGGLEPPRGCPQRFLRPPRLPFRHFGTCLNGARLL